MLKTISMLAVFSCFTLTGVYCANKLKNRKQFLCDFISFMSVFQTYIRYSGCDIFTLISNSMTSKYLQPIKTYICENKGSFNDLWLRSISCIPKYTGLIPQDIELLKGFGELLGTTDEEGQISHIELYTALFQKSLLDAEQNVKSKSRLYSMLGLFAGTAFVLMVI